jgi:hypothetical protein
MAKVNQAVLERVLELALKGMKEKDALMYFSGLNNKYITFTLTLENGAEYEVRVSAK